jgi:hypothetical protein
MLAYTNMSICMNINGVASKYSHIFLQTYTHTFTKETHIVKYHCRMRFIKLQSFASHSSMIYNANNFLKVQKHRNAITITHCSQN